MSVVDFGGRIGPGGLGGAEGAAAPRASPPLQARSRRTLERLFEAAERVFVRDGFAGATVAGIVAEAGVSVGAFYGRFPDKAAFLEAFFDQSFERGRAAIDADALAAASDGTAAGRVRAYVGQRVAHYRDRRAVLQAVQAWLAGGGGGGAYARRRGDLADHAAATLLTLVGPDLARAGCAPDEARRRTAFAVWLIAVGANDAALRGDARNGSLRFAERPLIDSLTRAALGVLGLPEA
ncbi:MAG: TetR/AcrR family transcriptional regulator [Caulobacteraceae bacterium]|nr:TetR/AcrR family transcriptional regulator [Caulobacteraceae bacterium]